MDRYRLTILAASVMGASGLLWVALGAAKPESPQLDGQVAALKGALDEEIKARVALGEELLRKPPVGTVMAFAGQWPPIRPNGTHWTEQELGWLLCDGRTWGDPTLARFSDELANLRVVLGQDTAGLPDLVGCFLRGVDRRTDGSTSGRDKDGTRQPGSLQGYATAMPASQFALVHEPARTIKAERRCFVQRASAENGHQVHNATTRGRGFDTWVDVTNVFPAEMTVPEHTHQVQGGDPETRPVNLAVYWIIKFK